MAKSAADIAKELSAVIGANDEESTVSSYLDTGYPELNFALSSKWDGGFPVGRIVELAGPPSAGKTAIATAAMAAAQKAGGIAAFSDHERSFSLQLAPRLGLDPSPGKFIFKKPRTFEESIVLFHGACKAIRERKLIDKDAPICWVFDSLASMVPQSALLDSKGKEKTAEDRNMNDNTALARATSAHMPAIAMLAEEYNVCVIFLNQVRTKIGVMYGDPRTTPGGDAPKFYASVRVMLGASQIKDAKTGEVIGSQVKANVIKNKVSRPFLNAEWRFVFNKDGTGRFDVERSMVEFLNNEKLLTVPRQGFVEWQGKQYSREQLARHIEATGTFDQLKALLPSNYTPPVVATVADNDDDEAA